MFPKLRVVDGMDHAECVLRITDEMDAENMKNEIFKNSKWKRQLSAYVDTVNKRGYLQRASFMSGGVLHTSFDIYKESMHVLAEDIKNGVILPISEVAHNVEGVRLFF